MTAETEKVALEVLEKLRTFKYNEIDKIWGKILDDPPSSPAFYKELAERLVKAKKEDKLAELIALAGMQWAENNRHRDALKVINIVLPYFRNNPTELHEPLLTCLRAVYANRPNVERFLKSTGLLYDTEIKKNYAMLKTLLACDEGQVYRHPTRGVGVVQAMDEHEQSVEIDFGNGKPARFSFDGVRQFLQAVPSKHFLARKIHEPEKLKEWAQKDAPAFMRSFLRDFGGTIKQGDLKAHLTDRFFTEREWTSWWNKNRVKIRLDSWIEFRGSGNVTIVLRDKPVSFHEECANNFEAVTTWGERFEILRELMRVQSAADVEQAISNRLASAYDKAVAEIPVNAPSEKLDAAGLLQDLRKFDKGIAVSKGADFVEILKQIDDPQAAIQAMEVYDYQVRAVEALSEANAEWPEILSSMFLDCPLRLSQVVIKTLFARGRNSEATEALESLFARPSINAEVFVWASRQILEGKWEQSVIDMPPIYLLVCLLDFMAELGADISAEESPDPAKRNAYARIRELLMTDGHEHVCRILRDVSTEEARHFLASVQTHKALSDTQKLSIETALRNLRSDFEDANAFGRGAEMIFSTAEALQRVREEYQRIKTVEIPANSRVIAAARELGDLRENADYHAAKDYQKVLFARVEELHDLVSRARAFDPEAIQTDVVSPGTRIAVTNLSKGAQENYTLLGPWDAQLEHGVLSYQSPFGQQFLGKKAADEFDVILPSGEKVPYRVNSIENALQNAMA